MSEAACVFVIARHVDAGLGEFQILFELHGWRGRVILLDGREGLAGILVSLKAGGAEEDDGVLYLLAAEARQGFLIFGHDAEDASIRAVEERWIFVRHWRGFEVISHIETRNQKS